MATTHLFLPLTGIAMVLCLFFGPVQSADVFNASWGDDPETCKRNSAEPLTVKSASEKDSGRDREELKGQVRVGAEQFSISYIFFDGRLVKVSLSAIWSKSAGPDILNRDPNWNPFATLVSLSTLLTEKYGRCIEESYLQDGKKRGWKQFRDWADSVPYSGEFFATEKWELPRHSVELQASLWRENEGRMCFLTYTAKTPDAEKYEKHQAAERERKEQAAKEERMRQAKGL